MFIFNLRHINDENVILCLGYRLASSEDSDARPRLQYLLEKNSLSILKFLRPVYSADIFSGKTNMKTNFDHVIRFGTTKKV
jgi:hypothetical protein